MSVTDAAAELEVGLAGEYSIVVTDEATADAYQNHGVRVLATPHLVWMIEMAGNEAVAPVLPSTMASVGTRIDVRHLAPTPVGMHATARVRLIEKHGDRLVFDIDAWDDAGKIARGKHERHIVELDRFLDRVARKRPVRNRTSRD
ncbi:MAG TPA: thioesterase [Chloroflexota bacterium]|nr:thioesterase [Chloroflexota bacterium]